MSDTELTIVVMLFTAVIMALGTWISRHELVSEVKNTTVETDIGIEISRRKTAGIIGKIMLIIVVLLLSRPAVRNGIEKMFSGHYNFSAEVISILAAEALWIVIGISLVIYGRKGVK